MMAKIGQYYMETQQNPIAAVRQQGVSDPNAFGANVGQAMGNLGNAITNLGEVEFQEQLRQQEKRRKMNVMNAETNSENEITNVLYGENGLMHLQGDNALPKAATKEAAAVPGVGQRVQQSLADIRKKYLDNLTDDDERMVFGKMFDDRARAYTRAAMLHEERQGDIAFQQSREASRVNSANQFSTLVASGNLEQAVVTLRTGMGIYNNTGKTLGVPKDVLEQENKSWMNTTISNTIIAQAKAGNIELATQLRSRFGSDLDANTKAIVDGALKPIIEQNEILNFVETDIKNDPALRNPDGSINREKAKAKAASLFGPGSVKTVTEQNSVPTMSFEKAKALVSGNESSGSTDPYTAVNPDSGAYGKYQFMPDTWKGLMGDAPMTPENQEIAFSKMHKDTYDKYGVVGMLVANYAGTQNAERYIKGQDLIGDDGKTYSADAPQGNYPSVRQYVINALGNDGRATPTTKTVSAYDPIKWAKLDNLIDSTATDSARVVAEREHEELVRVKNVLANAATTTDKINAIESSALPDYTKADMKRQLLTREKSDPAAKYQLEVAAIDGTLSAADVQRAAPYLNQEDTMHYLVKVKEKEAGRMKTENTGADKKWKEDIDFAFSASSDSGLRQQLTLEVAERLDREGVKGWQRYSRAKEILNENGVVVDGKGKRDQAESVVQYGQLNTAAYGNLARDFGDQPLNLTIKGFVLAGNKNPDAWEMNKFLSSIGQQIADGDVIASDAYKWMIDNNIPINPDSYRSVYADVAENRRR
jgi:hypothetical protein